MTRTSSGLKPRRHRLSTHERERLVAEAQGQLSAEELKALAHRYGVKLRWVQQLLRNAGTPRPRYPAPAPDARERKRIVSLYEREPNISAVARKTGRTFKTVRLVLAQERLCTADPRHDGAAARE